MQNIESWIDAHREDMLRDLGRLVLIKSVRGEPAEGRPYGDGPFEALTEAASMCEKYGFSVKLYDNRVLSADLNDGERALDILCHLDVVGEGGGWDTDPFTAVLKDDGCLYGRGVSDDKGPSVAAMYALRAIKECGVPLKRNVRLILGSDEESGSSDIEYYYAHERPAPHTFSPDTSFPVYNTEKGHYRPVFTKSWEPSCALPRVSEFSGGFRTNVVPADASARVLGLSDEEIYSICEAEAKELGVAFSVKNGLVSVSGRGAHAAGPGDGINGLTALVRLLLLLPLAPSPQTGALKAVDSLFPHGDFLGKAAGAAMSDEISGELTLAFTLLSFDERGLSGQFDSRVPLCANEENCKNVIDARLSALGFEADGEMTPPHHVPADSPFIKTLLESYEKHTGLKGECLSMGGGTYVHDVEGGVAFGASMPGFDENMHGANEKLNVQDMLTACKIFADAAVKIANAE